MITLTFAGDEAGDVSFAFDKGASRYFVAAVIATPDPDGLRQLLADLAKNLDSRLTTSLIFMRFLQSDCVSAFSRLWRKQILKVGH